MITVTAAELDRQRARQALWASLALITLLGVLKHLSFSPLVQKIGFTLAAAFQLYLPLWLIDRDRERARDYGLHMHGSVGAPLAALRRLVLESGRRRPRGNVVRRLGLSLSRWLSPYAHHAHFDRAGFTRDIGQTAALCALAFPLFAVGHHFWQMLVADHFGKQAHYAFALPSGLLEMVAINLLLVALPEELFYRGFVFTRFSRVWPPWLVKFGAPVGKAMLFSSALFALGHYAGEWGNPARLGPFFPALVFCAMRQRAGSIMGAVLFHGLANICSEILRAGYTFH